MFRLFCTAYVTTVNSNATSFSELNYVFFLFVFFFFKHAASCWVRRFETAVDRNLGLVINNYTNIYTTDRTTEGPDLSLFVNHVTSSDLLENRRQLFVDYCREKEMWFFFFFVALRLIIWMSGWSAHMKSVISFKKTSPGRYSRHNQVDSHDVLWTKCSQDPNIGTARSQTLKTMPGSQS